MYPTYDSGMVRGKNLFHHEGHKEARRKNKKMNKNYLEGISAVSSTTEGGVGRIFNPTNLFTLAEVA